MSLIFEIIFSLLFINCSFVSKISIVCFFLGYLNFFFSFFLKFAKNYFAFIVYIISLFYWVMIPKIIFYSLIALFLSDFLVSFFLVACLLALPLLFPLYSYLFIKNRIILNQKLIFLELKLIFLFFKYFVRSSLPNVAFLVVVDVVVILYKWKREQTSQIDPISITGRLLTKDEYSRISREATQVALAHLKTHVGRNFNDLVIDGEKFGLITKFK